MNNIGQLVFSQELMIMIKRGEKWRTEKSKMDMKNIFSGR
jgi:hypothetical protein